MIQAIINHINLVETILFIVWLIGFAGIGIFILYVDYLNKDDWLHDSRFLCLIIRQAFNRER